MLNKSSDVMGIRLAGAEVKVQALTSQLEACMARTTAAEAALTEREAQIGKLRAAMSEQQAQLAKQSFQVSCGYAWYACMRQRQAGALASARAGTMLPCKQRLRLSAIRQCTRTLQIHHRGGRASQGQEPFDCCNASTACCPCLTLCHDA